MDQRELFFVAHIAEAAMLGKQDQCAAYLVRLAESLESGGAAEAAERLRKILKGQKVRAAKVSRVAPVNGTPRIPVDSESALGIADRSEIGVGSVHLVLSEENQSTIQQFIRYVQEADKLRAAGVSVNPSLLIYGPPGCGKTLAARYVAAELSLPLITARTDGLVSSFLGSTSKNVRKLFDYAGSEPCVLFLDEFDAIAKKRDDSRELGELKRVVISLLQNIDAFDGEHVLVAATNHDHLLDPAIWRRFAYKLHLELPDTAARTEMLKVFFGDYLPNQMAGLLAPLADGLSGAQIRLASDAAKRSAIIHDKSVDAEDAAIAILREKGCNVESRAELIRQLKAANPEHFSPTAVSRILNVSQPYVSKVLNKESSSGR